MPDALFDASGVLISVRHFEFDPLCFSNDGLPRYVLGFAIFLGTFSIVSLSRCLFRAPGPAASPYRFDWSRKSDMFVFPRLSDVEGKGPYRFAAF